METRARHIDARSYAAEDFLPDGRVVQIRAIRPDDKARLSEHFIGLSAEARYLRFFSHKRELTGKDLAYFTELDFRGHVGLAATLGQRGHERFIGVGRYVSAADPACAEIGLAVLDEYEGSGVEPLLLAHLSRIAHDNGITRFTADIRGDDRRMLDVLRKSGCIVNYANESGVVHFKLKCPDYADTDRALSGPKGDDHGRFLR